ncbi:unnamed protein product [Rotaria sp. Silwood1]|nr:unnamed protein product [Rotaria sp. Silwood1]CAF0909815.1 unnamed protein product [Rotaria sp. Silwood1]
MESKIERMESKIQQIVKKLLQSEECLPMLEKMIVDEVLNIDILVTTMFEVVDTLNEQTLTRLSTYIAQYITTHKSFSSLEEQLVNMNLHRQQLMKRILHNIQALGFDRYHSIDLTFDYHQASHQLLLRRFYSDVMTRISHYIQSLTINLDQI